MIIPDAALFGLGAAAVGGLGDLGGAIATRRVGSTRTTGVVVPATCLIIVTIFLATGALVPTDPAVLLGSVLSGLLGSVVYFSAFAALRAGPITVVVPIIFAYGGLTVFFSIVFLNEQPSTWNVIAAIVATIGVALTGIVVGGSHNVRVVSRGVGYALVALMGIALIAIVGTLVVRQVGWLPSFTVARVTNTIIVISALVALGRWRRRRETSRGTPEPVDATSVPLQRAGRRVLGLLLVLAALDVVGVSLFLAGLQVGPTWLVALTSSFAPLVGIIGGLTLFRERPQPLQWLGIGLVLGSALILAIA